MSVHGPARSRAPQVRAPRLPLGLVPHRARSAPRAPFVLSLLLVGAAGLVGLLVLNTTMQNRAFELSALQERGDALAIQEAALRAEVDALAAPQQVGSRAAALGMVPNPGPAFLQLSDGRVVGDPQPAKPGTNLRGLDERPATTPAALAQQRQAEASERSAEAQ